MRRGQPVRGLGRLVLEERPELAPAGRPVDQRDLANHDAAEANSHRQRDDVQAVEQVVERRGHAHQAQTVARSRPSQYCLRRSFLRILPVGLRGSSSLMSTVFGHL